MKRLEYLVAIVCAALVIANVSVGNWGTGAGLLVCAIVNVICARKWPEALR